jgi:2-polyprenyl-3-methyl-5-hydroxy-6-metoxy-1,4-benzoquinol methylase
VSVPLLDQLDARVPVWDAAGLIPRRCPFCGTDGVPCVIRPDGLTVRQCAVCDCRFVSPAPSEQTLARFYATYYTDHGYLILEEQALDASVDDGDVRLQELRSLGSWKGKRALDVGCGAGDFLASLQLLGMEITGVDLDRAAVEHARRQLRTERILHGGMERVADEGLFDLIAMNDFIEHPLAPMQFVERAVGHLKPGGYLLLFTPNGAFTDPRFPAYMTFRRDLEHMQYLTTRTIERIARTLDLSIVHLETCMHPQGLATMQLQPEQVRRSLSARIKRTLRAAPGFKFARRLRNRLRTSERSGSYSLLALLTKASLAGSAE